MEKEKKGRAIALLPIGVFLIIFLGAGIVFQDFYAMPAIVAFLIALFVSPAVNGYNGCKRYNILRYSSYCSILGCCNIRRPRFDMTFPRKR